MSSKDFEEGLEQFFVRKQCGTKAAMDNISARSKIGQKVSVGKNFYDKIPLLVCDVLKIDHTQFDEKKILFHAFGISFKYCILHARVIGRLSDNEKYYKYIIDDSTASIEISICRLQSDLEKILCLQDEVESLKSVSAAQNKSKISDCLRRLLAKAKKEILCSNIPVGNKILVYGKLSSYRGKIGINVLSLFSNDHIDNLEIEYKDLLIEWYSEKYEWN